MTTETSETSEMDYFDAQMEKIQAEESGPDHRPVDTAIQLSAQGYDAAESGRYDLLEAEPDGWLNLSDLAAMPRDGYTVIAEQVAVANPDEADEVFGGALIRWHGALFVAELGEAVVPADQIASEPAYTDRDPDVQVPRDAWIVRSQEGQTNSETVWACPDGTGIVVHHEWGGAVTTPWETRWCELLSEKQLAEEVAMGGVR